MSGTISDFDLKFLEDKGYLLIKDFLSAEELQPLMDELGGVALAFGSTSIKNTPNERIDELFVDIMILI